MTTPSKAEIEAGLNALCKAGSHKINFELHPDYVDEVIGGIILAARAAHSDEPVGKAKKITCTSANTLAVFSADEVPPGTELYLAPPAPAVAIKPLGWRNTGYGWLRAESLGFVREILAADPQLEQKKVQAQAQYEKCVRLALVDAPTPDHSGDVTNMIPAGWKLVPEIPTKEMAHAAAGAHYGKRQVDQIGVVGIDVTANDINYTFLQAFRRFWKGALLAAPEPPVSASEIPNSSADVADCDADYAEIGREIVSIIGREVDDPESPLHDWAPAETYGEVISDLIDMIDEAKAGPSADPVKEQMAEALNLVFDNVERPPERNCTCHVNPPCSDCVDYGGLREMFEAVDTALDAYKASREPRP
ncbi:hypothetical protein [Pleomorphomonas sp. PLEO]|uniref:hypothetical protein n=1 Tax=Pleomorphomonas sp. PLEO TaxID=3239306 RepID=UPI00351F3884